MDASGSGLRALPVRDGADLLGILRLQEQEVLTPVEERLFAGLAAQAALVLRQTRLRAELSARLADLDARARELQASRERLLEAQDDERRRLERDIHDGAQQHLVALTVNLRLARTLLPTSPERAARVLAGQSGAARDALATLSELSRGIYPGVLSRDGLVPALRAAAATCPVPVTVTAHLPVRPPPDVEAALYFCSVEALQNAAKHSAAGSVALDVRLGDDGEVRVTVTDDGSGFDPASALGGTGLANMRDRLDAVGGTVTVTATTGGGARVEARVPASAAAVPASAAVPVPRTG
jgi:signal transduction histidine kinase